MNLSPDDTRRLEQAATEALADVDQLAADPETTRRLATYGEPIYGAQLTADLEANIRGRMALAGVAAFAIIRLNQANRRVDDLLDELTKVRAQLTAANRHADGAENDLRSAQRGLTEYADQTNTPVWDGPAEHVLVVSEPGVWTLKHPPTCPMHCPMFALMHAAMTTADLPVGQYEVQPNDLLDRALIGDRIDGPAVVR
ncbi:hypothetical protein [Micromonospora tarensis]|uniref:Uncharacterized protein n=1 Tax=Micromonospora tarensis TaxID=2806100 RepID=A0ABS1Y9Q4_9ACTN|nr:hypothetical protein [Micromonospora tarensis]MBM0274110.1 hypothetical protein [Micromonospora tarensis]